MKIKIKTYKLSGSPYSARSPAVTFAAFPTESIHSGKSSGVNMLSTTTKFIHKRLSSHYFITFAQNNTFKNERNNSRRRQRNAPLPAI
jgi:hypothetical protein